MSRRSGQDGYFSRKGNQWHVRFYIDVPGQEKRKRLSIPVCPISGPGKMTLPERIRRAKEIINASGANSEEHFNRVETANLGLTFGQQADRCLKESQSRKRKPVKPKTVCCWRSIIKVWLEDLGPMPLASVDNLAMKELVSKLHKAGQSPNSIRNVTNVVKMVVASAKNEQGEELFHRKWNHEFIDMPLIVREELNTPTFSAEEVSRIVAEAGKYQMLYILLAATGMRIGEAMALPVSRVVDNCTTLQVRHTYWEGQFGPPKHNSKRDIDLPEAVAAPFRQYLGGRTDAYVFQTNTGRPDSEHNIATRFFYPLLKTHGIEHKKGQRFHAFRRFRDTVLRADAVPGKDGVPEHLIGYWLGHKDSSMNGHYDHSPTQYKSWRKEWAEKAGCGFDLPVQLGFVGPKGPKVGPKSAEGQEVASEVGAAA